MRNSWTYLRRGTKLPPSTLTTHGEQCFQTERRSHQAGYASDVLFLSKCNLGVRESRILKKPKPESGSLADWWSVVMCLQWKSLEGDKQREMMSEQRTQQSALSSSHLFSQGLEEVFRSTQNKRTTKQKAHFTDLWDHSWVSSKCADPKSATSRLLLQIVANIGNL